MNILLWIIFGGLVGWVASIIMETKKRGLIRNVIVGLVGALLGGFLASLLGIGSVTRFTIEGFAIALMGAIIFIWLLRKL